MYDQKFLNETRGNVKQKFQNATYNLLSKPVKCKLTKNFRSSVVRSDSKSSGGFLYRISSSYNSIWGANKSGSREQKTCG